MQTKNWCYGAFEPTENAGVVEDQIRKAHDYYHVLRQIEIDRRVARDAILSEHNAALAEAEAAVEAKQAERDAIFAEISSRSAAERKKVRRTPEESARLLVNAAELSQLRLSVKLAKKAAYEDQETQQRLNELAAEVGAKGRAARAASGLYWGTYQVVEEILAKLKEGPEPKKKPFDGSGKIAVQIINGLTVADMLANKSNSVRMVVSDVTNANHQAKGKATRSRARAELWIRVGSEGTAPIWAKFPFQYHRPLPPDGIIKRVFVERTKQANYDRWTVRIVVTSPQPIRLVNDHVVAVHVGWRPMQDGRLRVASWMGTDGQFGELCINPEVREAFSKPDSLQAIRDRRFNSTCDRLARWVDAAAKRGVVLPDWIMDLRPHMRRWKSQKHLVRMCGKWRHNRFNGDSRVYDWLVGCWEVPNVGWRRWDKHLWQWQHGQRKRVRGHRNDVYRVFAKRLAQCYGFINIVEGDWAKLREIPEPGIEEKQTTEHRYNSAVAAIATLNTYLKEAFGKDCVVTTDIANITRQCAQCGHVSEYPTKLVHACSSCQARYDIDRNALRNQLARVEAQQESQPSLATVMAQRVTANSGGVTQSAFKVKRDAARKRVRESQKNMEE